LSRRTRATNAFRASTTGLVSSGAVIVPLDTVAELDTPGYMTLSPFSATLREVIKYEDINGNNLETLTRGLPGSVGNVAHEHPNTSVVVSAPTQQVIDDLFTDIEDLETGSSTWVAADTAHANAADPHNAYVEKAGDTMTGELILPVAAPSTDPVAANKKYVDDAISSGGLPTGTRVIFDQDTAPVGWTRDTSTVDDKMIRIVTGARADGGTWTQPVHDHTTPNLGQAGSHQHSVDAHTHSIGTHAHGVAQHTHTQGPSPATGATATAQENGGSNFSYAVGSHTHTNPNTALGGITQTVVGGTVLTQQSAPPTDSQGQHNHTLGSVDDSVEGDSWRPLHRDMIIAVKD
jgi:hypothetical protein